MSNEFITTPYEKVSFYIDVNSNALNDPTSGFNGTNNNLDVNIQQLILDPDQKWTIQLHSFYYKNVNLGGNGIYPIVLCDLCQNIRTSNSNASILYKSTQDSDSTNHVQMYKYKSPNFIVPLTRTSIKNFNIRVVRSDDGKPFPLDPASSIQIVLLIKNF